MAEPPNAAGKPAAPDARTEVAREEAALVPPANFLVGAAAGQHYTSVPDNLVYTTKEVIQLAVIEELEQRDSAAEQVVDHRLRLLDARSRFLAAFAFLVPIVLTLVTVDFKRRGLSADTWQAMFVLLAVISGLATAGYGVSWLRCRFGAKPSGAQPRPQFSRRLTERISGRPLS